MSASNWMFRQVCSSSLQENPDPCSYDNKLGISKPPHNIKNFWKQRTNQPFLMPRHWNISQLCKFIENVAYAKILRTIVREFLRNKIICGRKIVIPKQTLQLKLCICTFIAFQNSERCVCLWVWKFRKLMFKLPAWKLRNVSKAGFAKFGTWDWMTHSMAQGESSP